MKRNQASKEGAASCQLVKSKPLQWIRCEIACAEEATLASTGYRPQCLEVVVAAVAQNPSALPTRLQHVPQDRTHRLCNQDVGLKLIWGIKRCVRNKTESKSKAEWTPEDYPLSSCQCLVALHGGPAWRFPNEMAGVKAAR